MHEPTFSHEQEWYRIQNIEELDSPALVFYQERIIENIELIKRSIDQVDRLRPHVKTHKSEHVTQLLLAAGLKKFKCATIAEAEMLGMSKAPDVLLAYQPVGPKIDRWIALLRSYPDTEFSCLVDHEAAAGALSDAAQQKGLKLRVYMDVNVGMNRTGVTTDKAFLFYQCLQRYPGLSVQGIHAYDGHIHDASLETREERCIPVIAALQGLKVKIQAAGITEPDIIAGGSPTFPVYAAQQEMECSPGTFVLWDKGYQDAYTEQAFHTAALVITRVISLTEPRLVTVDLGHKSIAAENLLSRRVYFLNAPDAVIVSQSEEHLVLDLGPDHGWSIGDILYGLPVHICPTVALYERAHVVYNQRYKEDWMITSRNRKITI